MKINEEILTKYANGQCSPEEILRIETWLNEGYNIDKSLYLHDFQTIRKDIWNKLRLKVVPDKTIYYKKVIWYAAACLLSGIAATVLTLQLNLRNTKIAIGEKVQSQISTQSLEVKTMSQSYLCANSNDFKKQSKILFCGHFELSNKTESDWEVEISSSCHTSPFTTKKIEIQKDTEYLVIHHTFKSEEIMIIDVSRINDLSPVMWHKVENIFKI